MYTSYPDVGEQKVVVFLFSIYWSSWYITTNIELFLKTNFSFNYVHVFYVWVLLSARRRDEALELELQEAAVAAKCGCWELSSNSLKG